MQFGSQGKQFWLASIKFPLGHIQFALASTVYPAGQIHIPEEMISFTLQKLVHVSTF